VADLAVRPDVVGADQVARVDVGPVNELVDLDGAGRFQRDLLEAAADQAIAACGGDAREAVKA